jgi:hypothetical protein
MKLESLPASSIPAFAPIIKLLLMKPQNHSGKIPYFLHISIVMEFADHGDLLQEI